MAAGLAVDVPAIAIWPALLSAMSAATARFGSPLQLGASTLAAVLFGALRASMSTSGLSEGPLTPFRDQVVTLRGTIAEAPRCATSCLFGLRVRQLETLDGLRTVDGLIQVRTSPSAELSYGRAAMVRGQLRAPRGAAGFPRVEILARRGIHEVVDYPILKLGDVEVLTPRDRLESLRAALEHRLSESLSGPEGQLAAGLLLGREAHFAQALQADLQATGTGHIVAVSGFNVALVGGAALGLAGRALSRLWAVAVATLVVALYTLLVGAPASAVRAALMFGAAGLATIVGRLPDPLTSLVLAAAVMGVVDPPVLLDLGFQLSFAATAGLVLLGGHLTPTWRRLPRGLAAAFGLTMAAQIMTLPIVLHAFHAVSLVAPIVNVLIGPALPLQMASALLPILFGSLPGLGSLLAAPAWLLGRYVLGIVGWAAQLPSATLATGSLPLWALVAAYVVILAPLALARFHTLARGPSPGAPLRVALGASMAGLLVVAQVASVRSGAPGQLRAVFLDSAGDGLTLVETPSGRRILLGSAGSALAVSALAEQLPLLDRSIDLLVVTRAGERDLDGLLEIARRYPVGLVLHPGGGSGEARSAWVAALAQRAIPTIDASPGASIEVDDLSLQVEKGSQADDRTPAVSARLRFGTLDLLIAGQSLTELPLDDRTIVVRLAPELGLNRLVAARLAEEGRQSVVVGGRRAAPGTDGPIQLSLAGGEMIELNSDGAQTSLRRLPCRVDSETCFWP